MRSDKLPNVKLPANVSIQKVKHIPEGETNDVYFCRSILDGKDVDFFLKINKHPKIDLKNEDDVLQALQLHNFPVPRVIFSSHNKRSFIALEEIRGTILWDLIDPKRKKHTPHKSAIYLFEYGKWLARIHRLPLKWNLQKRTKLYECIGEELEEDQRFVKLILWLHSNKPNKGENVFVHGDYNTGSVIIEKDGVKGILDWEFAGKGWKEYDLAWALRARQHYLNSQEERDSILQGYSSVGTYNPVSLKWCEVLNYLHFAYWCKESDPEYMDFALDKANKLTENVK